MDRLYIRHTLGGKLFFDTELHQADWSIVEQDGISTFTINGIERQLADELLQHRDELNIFVVPQGQPQHRIWYYTKEGNVEYDRLLQQLTLHADYCQPYTTG